jgi:hypothetical protein
VNQRKRSGVREKRNNKEIANFARQIMINSMHDNQKKSKNGKRKASLGQRKRRGTPKMKKK